MNCIIWNIRGVKASQEILQHLRYSHNLKMLVILEPMTSLDVNFMTRRFGFDTVVANFDLGDTEERFQVIAISRRSQFIACGSKNGTVHLWNTKKKSLEWSGNIDGSVKWIWMPETDDYSDLVNCFLHKMFHRQIQMELY